MSTNSLIFLFSEGAASFFCCAEHRLQLVTLFKGWDVMSTHLPLPVPSMGVKGKSERFFQVYPAGVGGEFLNWNAGGFKPYVDLKVKKQQENIYKVIKPSV